MKTELKRANLHTPVLVGGTSLGMRLDTKEKGGLKLFFDEASRHLYVTYNGETLRIPEGNIAGMIDKPVTQIQDEMVKKAAAAAAIAAAFAPPPTAQVSTPQSHVHAGLGAGVTGQEPPAPIDVKRGPGRPKSTC